MRTRITLACTECKQRNYNTTWPDKDSLLKQSIAVVAVSVVIGIIITVLDFALQYGVDFLTTL